MVVLCLLAGLAGWILHDPDPVSEANIHRIQIGMTQREVIDILGEPVDETGDGLLSAPDAGWVWEGPNITIHVHFRRGKVIDKGWYQRPHSDLTDVLRKYVPWIGCSV
jgi:hypothetical protein